MARSCYLLAALALASALVAAPVRAQEPESWLLAEAIEVREGACVTHGELLASVENWLGRSAIDRRVRIVVEESEPGRPSFVVLRDDKPAAERRFRQTRIACPDLRAAVGLAIALAIDATILQSLLEPVPPPPEPTPPPEPPPAPEPRPLPPKRAPAAARRAPPPADAPPSVAGEAGALLLVAVLPEPAWGGSIGVIVPAGPLSIRAAGWATARTDVAIGDGTAELAMAAGELAACLERPLGASRIRGCAGGAGGAWSAHGRGFDVNRAAAIPWAAATAGFGLELPLGAGVALVGRISGYFPLVRPSLEVTDPGGTSLARREAPPAGVGASLGAMVGFP